MAQLGRKSLLLLSLILLSLYASGQIAFSNVAQLRNYGSPSLGNDRYTPYAIILSNNRPTFYLWDDTCFTADDGSMHLKPVNGDGYGCWEQATNAYLMAGTGLIRVGDTFSLNGYRLQWSDTATVVTVNRLYSQFLTKTQSDAKYLQSFSESDPIWVNERNLYYTKSQSNSLFITSEVDGSTTNEIQALSGTGNTVTLSNGGSYTIPAQSYSSLTGAPTIPAQYNPTAGAGISITGTYPNQTFASTYATPAYSTTARSLNASFRPSTTRPTLVSYSITLTTALSLLNLNSSAVAYLEISADNSTWVTINSAGVTRALSVAITLSLNETSYYNLQCLVPANYYARIRTVTSGGGTAAFGSGQEVQIL